MNKMSEESYPYPFFNEEGKVICQVCGKPYLVISPRHLGTHEIKYDEYKLRFPDAPLSCEEFHARGRFGKDKTIFVKNELDKIEQEEKKEKVMSIDDLDFEDDEPIPDEVFATVKEEIIFDTSSNKKSKPFDICDQSKDQILDHLRTFFTNIRKDYMIQEFTLDGRMLFEFISDFSDPVLKVNIEFPNAFWHNRMRFDDPTREQKLKECGWKVIKINSKAPSFQDIRKKLKGI
jgi:very-short-patch-repair endonuclease